MNPTLRNRIITQLSDESISKVILFGSQADGTEKEGSDIDLLVVTEDNEIPVNFGERMKIYNRVYLLIKDIKREHSIDLLVYTKPLYDQFIKMQSMFSKEIIEKGKILYEKND
jgi:hypothetical protein